MQDNSMSLLYQQMYKFCNSVLTQATTFSLIEQEKAETEGDLHYLMNTYQYQLSISYNICLCV